MLVRRMGVVIIFNNCSFYLRDVCVSMRMCVCVCADIVFEIMCSTFMIFSEMCIVNLIKIVL